LPPFASLTVSAVHAIPKIEDFCQGAIVERGVRLRSRSAIEERAHGVGVPSWVVASSFGSKATGILLIVRDLEIVLLFGKSYTKGDQVSTLRHRRNGSLSQHICGR
jgi:hypothetical protein